MGVRVGQFTAQWPPVPVSVGVLVKVIGVVVGGGVGVKVTGVQVSVGVSVGVTGVGVGVIVGFDVSVGVDVGGIGVGVGRDGVEVGKGGPGRPIILSRNTAIWPRVFGASGQ